MLVGKGMRWRKKTRARETATTAGWSRATRAEKTPESFSNLNLHTKREGAVRSSRDSTDSFSPRRKETEGVVKSAAVFSLLFLLLLFIFSFFPPSFFCIIFVCERPRARVLCITLPPRNKSEYIKPTTMDGKTRRRRRRRRCWQFNQRVVKDDRPVSRTRLYIRLAYPGNDDRPYAGLIVWNFTLPLPVPIFPTTSNPTRQDQTFWETKMKSGSNEINLLPAYRDVWFFQPYLVPALNRRICSLLNNRCLKTLQIAWSSSTERTMNTPSPQGTRYKRKTQVGIRSFFRPKSCNAIIVRFF